LLFIAIIVGLVMLVSKSKKQAEESEQNIVRMINSLPEGKRTAFMLQLNNVRKNPTTAVILALLLGNVGGHKFYLGQTGMGIVYILFAWTTIPGWIAFIEAFSIGAKTAKYNEKKAQEYLHMFSA
jgi:TM2 domain-containing membrane protein YozV